ncbi:hypothetical protein BDZ97DRAFT_1770790 [Flammula alnicola]|nr:hypothetical protein BDZ97DRAFT_1770790 [Flammula alnicola]
MPSPLYASLQPAWTFLSQKLIWFALTPETRHVSAASRVLAQVAPLMANYMPELEATGTREPRACTYIRRWMWFLAHAANEPIPEFARIDIFNVTQEANFYPLHADWVSGAGLKLAPPYPQFVGVAQRLLDAEWVSSPAVEAAQDHLAVWTWVARGKSATALAAPLSAREDPGDRLRSLLEPPPRPSKTRKGKARARTPPSPPRAPTTRAAAARLAAASRLDVVQDRCPSPTGSPWGRIQFSTPPVCTACRLKGLEPEECVVHQVNTAVNGARGTDMVSARSERSSRIKSPSSKLLWRSSQSFGRLHRTSAWNLVQREYVRQSELEMSALSREISGILHRLVAMDPDDSFRDLYVEDNDAMAALVDVLSASAPGSLPTTDPHPNSRTTLSELASLLEGVPAPNWFPRPDHRYLPRAVPPQENVSEAGDVAGSVDTDTALAELDELDEQVAILDSLTSAK